MGMTIKSALEYLKDFDSYTPYQEAINKVSDWIELFQVNYEDRLKADMAAMLTEIQLELDEMKITKVRSAGFAPYSKDPFRRGVNCSKEIIQQKIDSLKGGGNDSKKY